MDYQLGPGPLQVDQNTIDEKIKGDIGIVENGDVATHAIPGGYYVIWKGDLYVAKTDISSGTTLSSASNGNLTAKTQGIGADVAALNSNLAVKRVVLEVTTDANGNCNLQPLLPSNAIPIYAGFTTGYIGSGSTYYDRIPYLLNDTRKSQTFNITVYYLLY